MLFPSFKNPVVWNFARRLVQVSKCVQLIVRQITYYQVGNILHYNSQQCVTFHLGCVG